MILGNLDPTFGQGRAGAITIEPCRGNETIDAPADHVFEQRSTLGYPARRIPEREAQEFAFSSGHQPSAEAVGLLLMSGLIAMEIAVEEDLDSRIRPGAEACREGRTRDDRSVSPMVGNDQHREPITDEGCKEIDEMIDLAFEAGRDIMDRC